MTLVSNENISAFQFGIVDEIAKGYVSSDMTTLIAADLGDFDDFRDA